MCYAKLKKNKNSEEQKQKIELKSMWKSRVDASYKSENNRNEFYRWHLACKKENPTVQDPCACNFQRFKRKINNIETCVELLIHFVPILIIAIT